MDTIKQDIKDHGIKLAEFESVKRKAVRQINAEITACNRILSGLNEELRDTKKLAASAQERLDSFIDVQRSRESICPKCRQPIRNQKHINTYESLERNVGDFNHGVTTIERKQQTTSDKIIALNDTAEREKGRQNPYQKMVTDKEYALEILKNKMQSTRSKINDENEAYEAVYYWVTGFKRIRLFIIEDTLRQLELEVNNSLGSLGLIDWRVEFDVERENKSGGVTKGFVVFVHAPGAPGPVRWESWGGGATQRLRLAGDFGLANLIMERAGLRNTIEVYDEPSKHMSQEGLLDMAETLYQRAISSGKRIFLVDHHAIDFGDFAGTITITKDKKGSHIPLKWT